jgi:hypothetical protein
MKYVKILGLLAVAAAAMMAFAASASATTVTGPNFKTNGEPTTLVERETPVIHAVSEKEVELHNAIVNIKCESTVEGKVETHGSGITAEGKISVLNFFNCTDEWVVDVKANGSLIVHYTEGNNGTLTSTGARVIATRAGLECIYETNATDIGTVTGEKGANGEATLDISAEIPRVGGSFLCGGAFAKWTGSYITTHTIKIDP